MTNVNNQTNPEPFVLQRRIGSTAYHVGIFFKEDAKETLKDKVIRLLKNDLNYLGENGTIEPLQAGWLSEERGSA